jgi:DNA invertase Pin-like site-specific DNA recombinase
MFHVVAAMAEFERALIRERVSAGIQAARNRGQRIGRPRTYVNPAKVRELREADVPWRVIARQLGIGVGTAVRAIQ